MKFKCDCCAKYGESPCTLEFKEDAPDGPLFCPFNPDSDVDWVEVKESVVSKNATTGFDAVKNPSHYCEGRKYEPIDVIEDWELGFNTGNALKYISRAGRKDDVVQDLEKARWYIDREIKRLSE